MAVGEGGWAAAIGIMDIASMNFDSKPSMYIVG